jgi:hypothetical protein
MEIFKLLATALNLFFVSLPLILINLCIFFAVGLANPGMAMMVLGQAVIVPIAVYVTQILTGVLGSLPNFDRFVFKPASDLGQLVTSEPYMSDRFNVAPSFWVAQVVFFFAYLFSNALDVYNIPAATDTPVEEWRVENRKARSVMIMSVSVFLLIFLLSVRALATDLETVFGIALGLIAIAPLGYGWYRLTTLLGVRKMDVFGIVQQMVPVSDDKNITYCVAPPSN